MKDRILIPQEISRIGIDFLEKNGYVVDFGCGAGEKEIIRSINGCKGLLIRNARVTKAIIDAAPHLRVIARHGVGVDTIDVDYATKKNVWVTNAPESNFNAVAEHTIMMMLVLAKNLIEVHKTFSDGDFNVRHRIVNMELPNKTLGIVGFGRVGKEVARKAFFGLGMKVLVFDPYYTDTGNFNHVQKCRTLVELFSQSDFISLHLPVTVDTKGLINSDLLGCMKRTAYLINAARHEIINEEDFISAMVSRQFAGAAIDVFEADPPDNNSPMLHLPNVVYTPHNAAHTVEAFTNMAMHAAQGIHEVLSGNRPTWPVNNIIGNSFS